MKFSDRKFVKNVDDARPSCECLECSADVDPIVCIARRASAVVFDKDRCAVVFQVDGSDPSSVLLYVEEYFPTLPFFFTADTFGNVSVTLRLHDYFAYRLGVAPSKPSFNTYHYATKCKS